MRYLCALTTQGACASSTRVALAGEAQHSAPPALSQTLMIGRARVTQEALHRRSPTDTTKQSCLPQRVHNPQASWYPPHPQRTTGVCLLNTITTSHVNAHTDPQRSCAQSAHHKPCSTTHHRSHARNASMHPIPHTYIRANVIQPHTGRYRLPGASCKPDPSGTHQPASNLAASAPLASRQHASSSTSAHAWHSHRTLPSTRPYTPCPEVSIPLTTPPAPPGRLAAASAAPSPPVDLDAILRCTPARKRGRHTPPHRWKPRSARATHPHTCCVVCVLCAAARHNGRGTMRCALEAQRSVLCVMGPQRVTSCRGSR